MAELILHLPGIESISGSALPDPLADALCKARYAGRYSCDPLEQVLGCAPIPAPAVLSVLGQGLDPADRYWLRFDVLRMVPDLTAVWIDRPLAVDFDAPAYADLRAELAALFDSEGLEGRYRFAGRFGLIDLPTRAECGFAHLDAAQGGRLDEFLPDGAEAPRWRRLITASQMLFHRYRALDRADQTGAGLWFWGGGASVAPGSGAGDLCVADAFDSAPARGLANWLGASVDSRAALGGGRLDGRLLAGLPLAHAEAGQALRALVSDWLRPALEALRRGSLARVTVVGSSGVWRLGRLHPLAFWRRRAQGLAQGAQR